MSPRAAAALRASETWVVEDTRVSAKLQALLEVKRPMRVLNDHTGPRQVGGLAELASRVPVALLTDAGSPGISDPGSELVDACLDSGIEVDAIPGPSAVTTALALAGFFAQRFAFLGFLSRKPSQARETLSPFIESTLTLVLFESPHRVSATLAHCHETLGSRRYAICRELTKSHQQVYRDTLPQTPSEGVVPRKGEFTLVIEGVRRNRTGGEPGWVECGRCG